MNNVDIKQKKKFESKYLENLNAYRNCPKRYPQKAKMLFNEKKGPFFQKEDKPSSKARYVRRNEINQNIRNKMRNYPRKHMYSDSSIK